MDSWVSISIALISAVVTPLVAWRLRKATRGWNIRRSGRWRRVRTSRIPIWVVYGIYKKRFPTKESLGPSRILRKGTFYEYEVRFKDPQVYEPWANTGHMTVYRRPKGRK